MTMGVSIDDSSVSIVEKHGSSATVHFLENVTADSREYKGIHPIVALDSHQENLAKLVHKSLRHLPPAPKQEGNDKSVYLLPVGDQPSVVRRRKPDFISVTRGPGMLSSLSTGLNTAKGLSVAWQVPLVGVHHMQAHLLTPRLAVALEAQKHAASARGVEFPFLSILVSGGHTLLVHSKGLVDHQILGSTADIAIGDALDKIARVVLPPSYLEKSKTTMYGKALEAFVFPNGKADYTNYKPPSTRGEEIEKYEDPKWNWTFTMPYSETTTVAFSFAGLLSTAHKQVEISKVKWGCAEDDFPHDARVALGREFMRVCFEHLASRTVIALRNLKQPAGSENWSKKERRKNQKMLAQLDNPVKTLVISGGVAANQFLRHVLRSFLDVRGFRDVEIVAPPMYLCTDNAAMIGWTGIEMYEAGWTTDLKCRATRKWSLDPNADDGGILGPNDWVGPT
ncbi:conserved hypothetical protein [Uncinocarpus reesii 1704]|uniref:Gcp-like domain-containing protein n=1 Tax=Uncinocarpus reesii (strain UAMH 1704) TaxID=336963 RepID=C4JJS1_UNCRE|nr:uncharacterized protein UREG_01878 [Uncinocarpus reesii 1704]EEP77029.1 conserved hypothetical protein [Uncinocarpus reesii 1704]